VSAPPRTVRTATLEIAYLERGPHDGPPVLLVHGFPDDARTWDRLAQALVVAGYRTIAPFLRGFGATRFVADAPRTGEITALACDLVAFADALGIARFHVVGHDWGARAAYGVGALWPERLRALCALGNPYGTTTPAQTLSVEQTRAYWYQWYFATPRGEDELTTNRRAFCRALWRFWAPNWRFSEDEYERTAASFENPDFVPVALTSYRQRWGFVPGVEAYAVERDRLAALPPLAVPTLTLLGADDGATLPSSAAGKERLFRGPYRVETIAGSGHFLQREQPALVAERVVAHLRAYETA
jgi:pimeloyl-ACP methyl ester carboxylesterase